MCVIGCVLQKSPKNLGLNIKTYDTSYILEMSSVWQEVYAVCMLDKQCTLAKLRCVLKLSPKDNTGDGVFINPQTPSIDFLLSFKEIIYLPHFKGKGLSCNNSCSSAVAFPWVSVGVQLHTWMCIQQARTLLTHCRDKIPAHTLVLLLTANCRIKDSKVLMKALLKKPKNFSDPIRK